MRASERLLLRKQGKVREFSESRWRRSGFPRKQGFSKLLSRTIAKLVEMLRFRCRFKRGAAHHTRRSGANNAFTFPMVLLRGLPHGSCDFRRRVRLSGLRLRIDGHLRATATAGRNSRPNHPGSELQGFKRPPESAPAQYREPGGWR